MIVSQSQRIERGPRGEGPPGFTFLEVLIALCIVLIALVPVIQLHVTSVRMIDSGSRIARATLLANGKLAEIAATNVPELGKSQGRIDEGRGRVFQWKSAVTVADLFESIGTAVPGVRRVHVDVTWQDGSRDAVVSVDTLIHVPEPNSVKGGAVRHDRDK